MMFHADITLVLALIALAAGALLVLMAKNHKDAIGMTCRVIGIIIAVLAILMTLCSAHKIMKMRILKYSMMHNMMYQRRMPPQIMLRKKMQRPQKPLRKP